MPHTTPNGWVQRSTPLDPNSSDILCRQDRVGLYDGDTDLRHFGEGLLLLTPTIISVSFTNVQPDPNASAAQQRQQAAAVDGKKLNLELPLSSVASATAINGFAMFSSPKVQLILTQGGPSQRISFRSGGSEYFFKTLEQCLKKKAWLLQLPSNVAINNAVSTTDSRTPSGVAAGALSAATTTAGTSAAASFSTTRAGIAGVVANQTQRADELKQRIRSATGEIDELLKKSTELSQLMYRFREEVAKGDFKLIDEQVEHLKRLDSRFAQHGSATSGNNYFCATAKHGHGHHHNQNQTSHQVATELVAFMRGDNVLCRTVRVPLVELFAAFNIHRGFGFELSPAAFHEAVCELVRCFPERRFSLVEDDPDGCATVPTFALRSDHLVQLHVLASIVPVVEKVLGPRPTSLLGGDSTFATKISAIQLSRLLGLPLDEAQQLLLQLELDEGVLCRDAQSSAGIVFSWNAFVFA